MEHARAVLDRLKRIDELRRQNAPAGVLLSEVRALLSEAESWIEADGAGDHAEVALERTRAALRAGEGAAVAELTAR